MNFTAALCCITVKLTILADLPAFLICTFELNSCDVMHKRYWIENVISWLIRIDNLERRVFNRNVLDWTIRNLLKIDLIADLLAYAIRYTLILMYPIQNTNYKIWETGILKSKYPTSKVSVSKGASQFSINKKSFTLAKYVFQMS